MTQEVIAYKPSGKAIPFPKSFPKGITPSPEQTTFLDWCVYGTGSCVLIAVAGAGKTFTLMVAAEIMATTQNVKIAICAYNKAIAEEIKGKLKAKGITWRKDGNRWIPPSVQAGTMHSFGLGALERTFGKYGRDAITGYKVENLIDEYVNPNLPFGTLKDNVTNFPKKTQLQEFANVYKKLIIKLVSFAKQRALGANNTSIDDVALWGDIIFHFDLIGELEEDDCLSAELQEKTIEQLIALAQQFLKQSNSITNIIDFDDMVYLPLIHACDIIKFDVVIIDEAQDTNPARRLLAAKMLRKGGRLIAVGDPCQAIYGFTGADSDSLEQIKRDFNAIELPLTTTYRCPELVVERAREYVSHIRAHANAIKGEVYDLSEEELIANHRDLLKAGSVILSRVNAPLVSFAFRLIKARIPCTIEGRDFSKGLVKLATRWKRTKTLDALEKKLDEHFKAQSKVLLARRMETVLAHLEDQIECLKAVIDQCRATKESNSVDALVKYIEDLFKDGVDNVLKLSSMHKSKGREWQIVMLYDTAHTCPSRWARQKWQQAQEGFLMYVAITRSLHTLIDVTVPDKQKEAA